MNSKYKFLTIASLEQVKINGSKQGVRRRALIKVAKDAGADEETLFPVVWSLLHNDSEYRLKVAFGVKNGKVIEETFEIPLKEYRKLPEIKMDEEIG